MQSQSKLRSFALEVAVLRWGLEGNRNKSSHPSNSWGKPTDRATAALFSADSLIVFKLTYICIYLHTDTQKQGRLNFTVLKTHMHKHIQSQCEWALLNAFISKPHSSPTSKRSRDLRQQHNLKLTISAYTRTHTSEDSLLNFHLLP